jgi:hypothetical protein
MNACRPLKFLLALLVSAGLVIAPLATPAVAEHSMPPTMHMAHGPDMADMAADMPCCPDKQKGADCQDCPFVAICVLKVMQAEPTPGILENRLLANEILHPLDDVIAEGLARPPPDQPPRSLV